VPWGFFVAITAAQLEVKFTSSGASKVTGELKSLGDAVQAAGSGFEEMYQRVNSFAERALGGVTRIADGIGKISLTGIVALFTKGTMAAWKQVDAVQQATIALRAYEKDATKVDKVLKDLLAFARSDAGKLFLREELFHAAQALRVAGAETENLTRYVEIMSRSVNSGMGTWNDLERVIARVGSTGRLTTIEFELLQQMGYQLDESLRNTTVTWEELFDALDRGSVQVEGQSETIQGRLMSLSTAIRGIGTAFLAVDSETSEFIEGGLGDRLVSGIDLAIDALGRLQGAAQAAGGFAATILDGVEGLVAGFQMLPAPIQNTILGVAGAIAAFGMFRQAIAATTAAMRLMGLGAFTAMFSPLGLAITGVVLAGGLFIKMLQDAQKNAEAVATSIGMLTEEIERLKLAGSPEVADEMQRVLDMITAQKEMLSGSDWPTLREQLGLDESVRWEDVMNPGGLNDQLANVRNKMDDLSAHIIETVNSISTESGKIAYLQWVVDEFERVSHDVEGTNLDEVIENILTKPASEVPGVMDEIADSADNATASISGAAEGLATLFGYKPSESPADDIQKIIDKNAEAVESANETAEQISGLIDDILARREELFEMGNALAGFDNARAHAALSGLGGDAAVLAHNLAVAGEAAENVFRIIVGNTDAIKSQADQILSWADNLIAVRGEWSRLDELVQKGLITGESGVFDVDSQYAAAQDAYDSIAISTERIKDNLDAVQAIQAPLIAEAQERTAAWTESLLEMDAAQQRVALGWYDSATAAQALEAQMLITAAAAGEMGASGREATQGFIEGAIAANPVLEDLLTDLELVSRDHEGNLIINFDGAEGARSEIDLLNESIRQLTDVLDDGVINGSIGMQVTGKEDVDEIVGIIEDVMTHDGETVTIGVEVSAGAGEMAAGGLLSLRESLNIPETVDVQMNVSGLEDVESAQSAIEALADTSVTVSIVGDDSDAQAVAAYWAGYNAITFATVTVAIVADDSDLTSTIASWSGAAGGGSLPGEPTGPTITVRFEPDTSALQLENLTSSLYPNGIEVEVAITGNAGGERGALTVIDNLKSGGKTGHNVEVNIVAYGASEAVAAIDGISAAIATVPSSVSTTAVALTEGATFAIDTLAGAVTELDGRTATVTAIGIDDASDEISTVSEALSSLDGNVATVYINAVDNASAVINAVASGLYALDGRTATSYVTTVNTTMFRTVGSPLRAFAEGGYVTTRDAVLVGERGPELVQLPYGSYVHTAEETARMMASRHEGIASGSLSSQRQGTSRSGDIHLHVGPIYGSNRDEIHDVFEREIVPEMLRALREQERALGVA